MAYLKNLWRFIVNGFRVFGEASRGRYSISTKEVETYKREILDRDTSGRHDAVKIAKDLSSSQEDLSASKKNLEEMYQRMMQGQNLTTQRLWEKKGDNFRQFSLYDYSGYETHTTSMIR